MTESAAGPNKRALLIGVNKYPNLPDYSQLRGCVNDVEAMRNVLEATFKFPPANIRQLVDEEATEKNIREAMEKLVADCGEGDIVVFHYSGHGSQIAAKGDKPLGYDESIMPYDSGRMNPNFPRQVAPRDIRDTEIQEWLSRLTRKTPHVTLIFDSCHSGSITRLGDGALAEPRCRWVPPDPLPEGTAPSNVPSDGRAPSREVSGSGWLPPDDRYVLLAACAAEQGAFELDNPGSAGTTRHGAFTFYLTSEIEQGLHDGANTFTYRDIWERVVTRVTGRFQRQTPQLEGARDRRIFDVQDFSPMRYLLVTERRHDEVRLAGGAIHGLAVGSLWDIYPAGTKLVTEAKEERQGVVKITEVKSISARAKIVMENPPGSIDANARAVEVLRADPETQMLVRLAPSPAGHEQAFVELGQTLAQSGILKIADSTEGARAEVRMSVPHKAATQQGISSGGSTTGEALWEVTDGSSLIMPRYAVAAPESRLRIKDNLETIWRFQKLLEVRNDKSDLKGKVDFILLKKDGDGNWQIVPEDETPIYQSEESIAFRVVNRSDAVIYVSVLDLGLSRRIDVLYPRSAASEPVGIKRSGESTGAQNGGVLKVGEDAGEEIKLFFPDDLTFLTEESQGEIMEGSEYFKLIVTTQRHDLSFLNQSGLSEGIKREPQHPLERLLYLAAKAEPLREARVEFASQEEWFTCERHFRLRQGA
jgi:hypothetical protein